MATHDIDLATEMNEEMFLTFNLHKDIELGYLLQCALLKLRGEREHFFP